MDLWIVATCILLWTQRLLAQKSQVTCSSSFDWAKNEKGQDPCVVAALLQASCRNDTNITISTLAENEIYIGPNAKDTNDVCACNSVIYSLLSVCAACQDRFYIDWPSWTKHCALAYFAGFPIDISSDIPVPSWAFNAISAICNRFDMDEAIRMAITKTQTTDNGVATSRTRTQNKETPVNLPPPTVAPASNRASVTTPHPTSTQGNSINDPMISQTGLEVNTDRRRNLTIVGGVVGSIVGVAAVILGVLYLVKVRPRRRQGRNLSATQKPVYKRLLEIKIPQQPMTTDQEPSFMSSPLDINVVNRNPGVMHNQPSRISLPSDLYHTSPDKELYSPAAASSELLTTMGGHSEGHSGAHYSGPSSATSARPGPFASRRGPSRGSTLLTNLLHSPEREESRIVHNIQNDDSL